ncbi:hypothetical protein GE061_001863 [Apolygus lucorum]|uniref:BESS domain-containing protein n=1 Tax=Apolygus lucorum TaxID=248454 RepID=A0A8S9X5C4_APOLU|nr:hypothetical protein GE061_001863 [Apolygus lucorum]
MATTKTDSAERKLKKKIRDAARYQRMKADPELALLMKIKEQKRFKKKKENGQRKLVSEMSSQEKREAHKKWKKYSKAYRQNKKNREASQTVNTSSDVSVRIQDDLPVDEVLCEVSPERSQSPPQPISRQAPSGRKLVRKDHSQVPRYNQKMQERIDSLERKVASQRQKFHRLQNDPGTTDKTTTLNKELAPSLNPSKDLDEQLVSYNGNFDSNQSVEIVDFDEDRNTPEIALMDRVVKFGNEESIMGSEHFKVSFIEISQAKGQWKTMRQSFLRALKTNSTAEVGENFENATGFYTGKWPYFGAMSFLAPGVTPLYGLGSPPRFLDSPQRPEPLRNSEKSSHHPFETIVVPQIGQNSQQNNINEDFDPLSIVIKEESLESSGYAYNNTATGNTIEADSKLLVPSTLDIDSPSRKRVKTDLNDEAEDDDMNFFKSLLPYMKKLSAIQKLAVRNEFQNVIIRELTKKD